MKLEKLRSPQWNFRMHMLLWFLSFFLNNSRAKTKTQKLILKFEQSFCLYRYLNREWKSDVSHVRHSHCCWTETWVSRFSDRPQEALLAALYQQVQSERRETITPSSHTDNHNTLTFSPGIGISLPKATFKSLGAPKHTTRIVSLFLRLVCVCTCLCMRDFGF